MRVYMGGCRWMDVIYGRVQLRGSISSTFEKRHDLTGER